MKPDLGAIAPPLWPSTLRLPDRPPKLIYLDLNHWIQLSKARAGHPDGIRQLPILDECLKAVRDGRAIFPLSEFIYTEISKIRNYRRRNDLREVIEGLCQYEVVTALTIVVTHEIQAVLDEILGPYPGLVNATDYLDWGVDRAFGKRGGLKVETHEGHDITEEFRQSFPGGPEAFDALSSRAQLELNRKVIDGPTVQEEPELKEFGWNPEAIIQTYERQAADEISQVRRFDADPRWRRGRIRDAIAARVLIFDIGDILAKGLAARGPGAEDRFYSLDSVEFRTIVGAMPSFDVSVTLKASLHRDAKHNWTNNDIFDIRALALTIPYCDVVATDRSMHSHVMRHKLPERYKTVVIYKLTDLPELLG